MGKYKQWLHHQEVGARLRDEIAAHEAERDQVLKLAPAKSTPLPDRSNPIIAALLGQVSVLKAPEPPVAQGSRNGSSTAVTATAAEIVTEVRTSKEGPVAAETKVVAASKTTEVSSQATKVDVQPAQDEAAAARSAATNKPKPTPAPAKTSVEKPASAPLVAATAPSAQPDTIDPLLEQLLAQAESTPADPLEALNLLASQGPNLTRGDAPQPLTPAPSGPLNQPGGAAPTLPSGPLNQPGGAAPMLPTAPLSSSSGPTGQSALKTLLGETRAGPEPQKPSGSASASVALGVETVAATEVSIRAEAITRGEKLRSDTDELVASRPTEGYTEPRLIVPQWLRSMELGQEGQENTIAGSTTEEADSKQRFSVSLPFENEEDMRLHESVERWWQRWRQQG